MKPLSTARPFAHRVHCPFIIGKENTLKPYKPGALDDEPLKAAGAAAAALDFKPRDLVCHGAERLLETPRLRLPYGSPDIA